VLGPSVGGFIVSFSSWRWIFLAAVPFGIAGLIGNLLLRRAAELRPESVRAGSETLHGRKRLVPFIGAIALGATFIAVFVGSPFELTRQAHLQAWQVGLILLATPIGATIAGRLSGSFVQRGAGIPMMLAGLFADGAIACALLFVPATKLAAFALLLFAFGVGSGALQTPVIALSLAAFPFDAQSRAGALQRFVQNLAISGGAALCGLLIDRAGTSSIWIFTISVCIIALAAIGVLAYSRTQLIAATASISHAVKPK
jgi:predicted MFS family arabinose efflux permease